MSYLGCTVNVNNLSEEERLAFRGELKQALAEMATTKAKIEELRETLAGLRSGSDAAVDAHQAKTQPLQEELRGLDAARVEAVANGKKPPAKDDARRDEILSQIDAANRELEAATNEAARTRQAIKSRIDELIGGLINFSTYQNQLGKLASPEALGRCDALADRVQWTTQRLRAVNERVKLNTEQADTAKRSGDDHLLQLYRARLRKWQAIHRDADAEHQRAMDDSKTAQLAAMEE